MGHMEKHSRVSKAKKKRKNKRWLKTTGIVVLLITICIVGYVYSVFNNARKTINEQMNTDLTSIDIKRAKEKIGKREKLNILLLGVDKRKGDRGRSDTIIVLTIDPKKERMQMISIPRDTRTLIVGKGFEDKINHAYAFGGADMSVATVENMLDIEIDYFLEINMEGLIQLVDAVGGITVLNWIGIVMDFIINQGNYTWMASVHLAMFACVSKTLKEILVGLNVSVKLSRQSSRKELV